MDVHLPCFWMMVSDIPCSFNAIAPPARSECTPTRSGSIPFLWRFSIFTLRLTLFRICADDIVSQEPSSVI